MARETRPPPSSGLPGRLPGLGHPRPPSTSPYEIHGDPRRGAADAAPTAPHATAPTNRDRSGPAKFWDPRRVRVALTIALVASGIAHMVLSPWNLYPDLSGIEAKDPPGELSVDVDLTGDTPQEEPLPQEEREAPAPGPGPNAAKPDASAPKPKPDAGEADAQANADTPDAGVALADRDGGLALATTDGGAITDGGVDAGDGGALVASADAGSGVGPGGPTDPGAMVGLTKVINAGPQNVVLNVNVATIRKNPLAPRIGRILQVIPQWREFLKGSQTTIDPIRETEWILVYGPSLIHTDKDAVFVRYSTPDAVVDNVVDTLAKNYAKGGPLDVGVPGVKASVGFADNAERVFIRPQPKLLVITPRSNAHDFAAAYKSSMPPGPKAPRALDLVVRNPSNQVSIKGLRFSESLKQLHLWIVPDGQGGADILADGDCTDETAAAQIADDLTDVLKRYNNMFVALTTVSAWTKHLLDGARVVPEGKRVTLQIHASPDQLDAVITIVETLSPAPVP